MSLLQVAELNALLPPLKKQELPAMQGELERAAKRLFLGSSRIVGASRTDAGAHANGQVQYRGRDGMSVYCQNFG